MKQQRVQFDNHERTERVEIAYLKHQPFPLALLRPLEAARYPKDLKNSSLDIGCGDGFFASKVFGKKKITIGVDINSDVLEKSRNSGSYQMVLRFNGVVLPIQSGSIETVIANCVLEHVDNPQQLLSEIARVTKKGGEFYFSVPSIYFEEMLLGSRIFRKLGSQSLAKIYAHFMSRITRQKYYWPEKKWQVKLRKLGFNILKHEMFFDQKALASFDAAHWLSIPSIVTKILMGRWILLNKSNIKARFLHNLRLWCLNEFNELDLSRQVSTSPRGKRAFHFFTCKKINSKPVSKSVRTHRLTP